MLIQHNVSMATQVAQIQDYMESVKPQIDDMINQNFLWIQCISLYEKHEGTSNGRKTR